MNHSATFDMDDMTEEQTKSKIDSMMIEMQQQLEQIKHVREESERTAVQTDATMLRVREGLAEFLRH